jgi:hypothetical protein
VSETARIAGAVIGFRCWRVVGEALMSTRQGSAIAYVWQPGPQQAVCRRDPHLMSPPPVKAHAVPGNGCHCGFNAYHDLDMARKRAWQTHHPAIVGAIKGWGPLEVHWDGVRSEWAEITALSYRQPESEEFRDLGMEVPRQLANAYGVPLVPYADLESVAREHGEPVPYELRPPELTVTKDIIGFGREMRHLSNQAAVAAQQIAKVNEYFVTVDDGEFTDNRT